MFAHIHRQGEEAALGVVPSVGVEFLVIRIQRLKERKEGQEQVRGG